MTKRATFLLLLVLGFSIPPSIRADDPGVEFTFQGKQLHITIGGKPFATYVFQD